MRGEMEKNVRAEGAQAGKIRGTVISKQFKMEETCWGFAFCLLVCFSSEPPHCVKSQAIRMNKRVWGLTLQIDFLPA